MDIQQDTFDADVLQALRDLRLWHWRQMLGYRAQEQQKLQDRERYASERLKAATMREAFFAKTCGDFHIKQVQLLNVFFPDVGDTAERDDQAEGQADA